MEQGETLASSSVDTRTPDFLVIGAMRAGTTSLHKSLRAIDSLSLPKVKETDFFIESKNWSRGMDWYRGLFTQTEVVRRGEVCPNYAKRDVFPEVPGHVFQANRDVRLIYIVRDPVARALSHYRHTWISTGRVPDATELGGSWEERHILATSRYAWQLEAWLEHFDLSQVLILDFEELVADARPQIEALAHHIGVKPPSTLDALTEDNSVEDVARMPRWWHSMRNTSLGLKARSMAPSGLVQVVKSRFRARDTASVPELPGSVRARFAEALAPDAERFRKITGRAFENWSV